MPRCPSGSRWQPGQPVPAVWLLASFIVSGVNFLAYAIVAARRRITTTARGQKGFYYAAGLAEGTETIAVFILAALFPAWFPVLATVYAVACVITGLVRLALAWQQFGRPADSRPGSPTV